MSVTTPVVNIEQLPENIQTLLQQREVARQNKDYTESDRLREQIKQLGYLVNDLPAQAGNPSGLEILKIGDAELKPAKSFLLLFGSGEIAPSSVDIYRQTFLQLGKRHLKIALITTPAGFQPNVDKVYGEIKAFLLASLPDFNLQIEIIAANTHDDADDSSVIGGLTDADVIFMGPGSPTYAAKHLRGTLLLTTIIDLVKKGSTLILASAATLACSLHCLPVYEIYKVGEDLHWVEGLNIYKDLWQECSIIPHFNNREGGADLDTSYCYVGAARFHKLQSLLPRALHFIGIDEHTCLILDRTTRQESVRGKGGIHRIE